MGGGFVALVDILKVADDVAAIDDEEVREGFENLLAAKRLIQNASHLPTKLIDRVARRIEDGTRGCPPKKCDGDLEFIGARIKKFTLRLGRELVFAAEVTRARAPAPHDA